MNNNKSGWKLGEMNENWLTDLFVDNMDEHVQKKMKVDTIV